VDAADPEAPVFEILHEIIEGVPEFGEDEEPLVCVIEESLFLQ